MAKDNGKDKDRFEGDAPDPKPPIGLRVIGATVKEGKDGGATAEVTVSGPAMVSLVKLVGEAVHLETVSEGRAIAGHVRAVTIAETKRGGAKVVKAKVSGARNLDGLVGLQVRLKAAQGDLPLGEPEASTEGMEPEPTGPSRRRRKGAPA